MKHITSLIILSICFIASAYAQETLPPPPPPPPPPPMEQEEIFKVVEQMPRFPGCEGMFKDQRATEECSNEKMLQYIYKNLKYPALAKKNKVEGMCVVQFVIDKDGSIKDAKNVRDIGAGCGEAAVAVVNQMNALPEKWTPGTQRGRAVKVMYTLPIKFKLNGDNTSKKKMDTGRAQLSPAKSNMQSNDRPVVEKQIAPPPPPPSSRGKVQ